MEAWDDGTVYLSEFTAWALQCPCLFMLLLSCLTLCSLQEPYHKQLKPFLSTYLAGAYFCRFFLRAVYKPLWPLFRAVLLKIRIWNPCCLSGLSSPIHCIQLTFLLINFPIFPMVFYFLFLFDVKKWPFKKYGRGHTSLHCSIEGGFQSGLFRLRDSSGGPESAYQLPWPSARSIIVEWRTSMQDCSRIKVLDVHNHCRCCLAGFNPNYFEMVCVLGIEILMSRNLYLYGVILGKLEGKELPLTAPKNNLGQPGLSFCVKCTSVCIIAHPIYSLPISKHIPATSLLSVIKLYLMLTGLHFVDKKCAAKDPSNL